MARETIRLESYTFSTDPVKRMRVRTHGKKTSKVKTAHSVLRKAEQEYSNGAESTKLTNRFKFNAHNKQPVNDWTEVLNRSVELALEYKNGMHIGEWIGTEKVKPVRGSTTKMTITGKLDVEVLDDPNAFLKELLRFKRIDHQRLLKDFQNFEPLRKKQLERIAILEKVVTISKDRRSLLKRLRVKWTECNPHTRYMISTNIFYDFIGDNKAYDIRDRAIRIGSIVVDKVFPDGGVRFSKKNFVILQAWIQANRLGELN